MKTLGICIDLSIRFSLQEDNSLRIHQVVQEDEGVYVCEAVNSYGQVQDDMMLTVSGKCYLSLNFN